MQLQRLSDPTVASRIIGNHADSYRALGIVALEETSPTSIRATIDPARSASQAASIAALIDPKPEWALHAVDVDLAYAPGPIDPMRASRAGIIQALEGLPDVRVHDDGPARVGVTTTNRVHVNATLRAAALNEILRDRVQLPPIPGLRPIPPIEVQVGPRAAAAYEHDHSPIIL